MVQLFNADNSSALWELVAAQEGAFFALPDYQLAAFAVVALYPRRFSRWFWRQRITLLVHFRSSFAVRIAAASQERPESAVFMYHRLAARGAFMLTELLFEHFAFFITGTGKCALRVR